VQDVKINTFNVLATLVKLNKIVSTLFEAVNITRRLSEFFWQSVPERQTSI